jgi:HK97 family phage portal protein
MAWWNPFSRRSNTKMSPEEWFATFGEGILSDSGITVTQTTAMRASAVMACVSILASDIAKLPAHVYARTDKGEKIIVRDHPLEKLLRRPNAWQTRFEWIEFIVASYLLRGDGIAVILRDGRGRPIALVPVSRDLVTLFEATNGQIFYNVARTSPHMMAVLKDVPLMVPEEDIFHLRWLSFNSLSGISRIGAARESIALALAQQEHAARLASNGARPGGVLTTDKKLSLDAAQRLKDKWNEFYAGVSNAGRTAVLEEGLKWQAMGMTSVDAEFLASRQFQVAEIARDFGVPAYKLGITDRSTNATMEQADLDYKNNVVTTHIERLEAKLDQTFGLAEQDLFVEFDVNRFTRAAIQVRYTAYRTGILGSFLTPNEARRAEGLPDSPNGDELMQPVNMAPLGYEPPAPATGGDAESDAGDNAGLGSDMTGAEADGGAGDGAAVPTD